MNIDKLLKKQRWTGEELGRLEIANAFTVFSQSQQGVKDPKPLISEADFQKMLDTIKEQKEVRTYNNYLKIHDWISKVYNMAIAQEQQAQLTFNKLLVILSNAMVAEDLYTYIERLPAIMTEKQYKDFVESDTKIFDGNYRAIVNGIAILRPSDLLSKSPCINEKGYYEAPDPRRTLLVLSLENFFTESKDYATEKARVEDERATFRESVYYNLGYNKALELIAEKYKVKEVLVAQMPFKSMIVRINAFNKLVISFYTQIKETHYEDKELQEKKLKVLKDILYPIDDSFLVIPEERIAQAKRAMKDFKAFKESSYDLCSILCTIPDGV